MNIFDINKVQFHVHSSSFMTKKDEISVKIMLVFIWTYFLIFSWMYCNRRSYVRIVLGAPFVDIMAGIAQLVEPRIVIPVVAGSSPVSRPTTY